MSLRFPPPLPWVAIAVFSLLLACRLSGPAGRPTSTPTALPTDSPPPPAVETALPPAEVVATESPAVSSGIPAGLTVVYTKEGGLWRWLQGERAPLTAKGEAYYPRISPDGQLVAFLRPADTIHVELWMVKMDGSQERRLVSVADLDALASGVRDPQAVAVNPTAGFAWLANSHRLAFTTYQTFDGPGLILLHDLHLVDADSGQIASLFLPGWGGVFAFSPDARRVALSQPDRILLALADGSDYREALRYEPVITYSEYRYYPQPLWSPQGDFLRLTIPPADPLAQPSQPHTLWRIDAESGKAELEGGVLSVSLLENSVVYSPDLKRLAVLREAGEKLQLILTAYDGGGEWLYASDPMLRFLAWSPSGRRFLYLTGEEEQLWLGSLDAPPRSLGSPHQSVVSARWVNEDWILYLAQRASAYELILLNLEERFQAIDLFGWSPNFGLPTYDAFLP